MMHLDFGLEWQSTATSPNLLCAEETEVCAIFVPTKLTQKPFQMLSYHSKRTAGT